MTETITIPKYRYMQLVQENQLLRNTHLYRKLLEAEKDIATGKKFTRKDLGF